MVAFFLSLSYKVSTLEVGLGADGVVEHPIELGVNQVGAGRLYERRDALISHQ